MIDLQQVKFNDPSWYEQYESMKIDRMGLIVATTAIQVAMLSRPWHKETLRMMRNVGRCFAQVLLARGFLIDSETKQLWEKLFDIKSYTL